jgi:hypothetical protein
LQLPRRHFRLSEYAEAAELAKRALALREAQGARFGRKHSLKPDQQADARRRLAAGESARALGKAYNVSHSTISRLRDYAREAV